MAPRWGRLSVDCYGVAGIALADIIRCAQVGGPVGLVASEQALDREGMSLIKSEVTSITTEHSQLVSRSQH